MTHSKVFGYVRTNLKKGYSKDDIRKALIKAGYDEAEIKKAFEDVENHHHSAPKLLWIVLITLVILGIAFLIPWNDLFVQEVAEPEPFQSFYVVDSKLCEEMSTEEYEGCFNSNKLLISSSEDCENIVDSDAQLICTSLINEDITYCDSAEGDIILFCKVMHAIKSNDVLLCQNLDDVSGQQFCELVVADRNPDFSVLGYRFIFE